jgi:hypothetical protein
VGLGMSALCVVVVSRQAVEALLDENLVSVAPPCTLEHMMLPYVTSRGGSIAVFGGENIINIAASLPYLEGRSIVGTWCGHLASTL